MQDPSDFQRSQHVRHRKDYVSRGFSEARRPSSPPSLELPSGRRAMCPAGPRHLYGSDLGPPDFVGVPSRTSRMLRVFHAILRFQDRGACDTPTRPTVGRWLRRASANIGVWFHFFAATCASSHDAGTSQKLSVFCAGFRTIATLGSYIFAPAEVLWCRQAEVIATNGPGRAWKRTRAAVSQPWP
jgi:hypothetical protein